MFHVNMLIFRGVYELKLLVLEFHTIALSEDMVVHVPACKNLRSVVPQ